MKENSPSLERLFVYGTLQPGGPNEHVLAAIGGEWTPAVVKGTLMKAGWGAGMGYPGLILDEHGTDIYGYVFSSPRLSPQWTDLDDFEGIEYQRTLVPVILESGQQVQAYVYALKVK